MATLIDGHRTVLDIVRELRECAQSQDVFHVLFILSSWNLIVPDDFNPQTVVNGIPYPLAGANINMKILRFFNLKIRMESTDSTTWLLFEPRRSKAV